MLFGSSSRNALVGIAGPSCTSQVKGMQMNKLLFFVLLSTILLLIISSCTLPIGTNEEAITTAIAETQQVATLNALIQTATQFALGPPASNTPAPTNTPAPSSTPRTTPTPRWPVVAIEEVEGAFGAAGYRRYPFTTADGYAAFTWIKDNNYFRATTFENGVIEIEVLHDPLQNIRAKGIETKLEILDRVFPSGFMFQLREENNQYNRSISGSVTGEPDEVRTRDDGWNTVWAEYNAEETVIGNYGVRFSLWWWQSTCPPRYHCSYSDFPGLDFEGDASITFYTIRLYPLESGSWKNPSL